MSRHDSATALWRAALAAEMRIAGMDYEAIAKELGYSDRSGAWKAAQRCLKARSAKAGEALWAKEMADLDLLQEQAWPAAMAGDRRAITQCLRAIGSRIRILSRAGESLQRG